MLAAMTATAAYGQGPEPAQVERPPQFVMLAFDNCSELERWRDLADFAADMNRDGPRLHFTFFVSGANFIEDGNRLDAAPHHRGRDLSGPCGLPPMVHHAGAGPEDGRAQRRTAWEPISKVVMST